MKEEGVQGLRLVSVLWNETSVKNINPKYINSYTDGSEHNHFNVSDKCFYTDSSC